MYMKSETNLPAFFRLQNFVNLFKLQKLLELKVLSLFTIQSYELL